MPRARTACLGAARRRSRCARRGHRRRGRRRRGRPRRRRGRRWARLDELLGARPHGRRATRHDRVRAGPRPVRACHPREAHHRARSRGDRLPAGAPHPGRLRDRSRHRRAGILHPFARRRLRARDRHPHRRRALRHRGHPPLRRPAPEARSPRAGPPSPPHRRSARERRARHAVHPAAQDRHRRPHRERSRCDASSESPTATAAGAVDSRTRRHLRAAHRRCRRCADHLARAALDAQTQAPCPAASAASPVGDRLRGAGVDSTRGARRQGAAHRARRSRLRCGPTVSRRALRLRRDRVHDGGDAARAQGGAATGAGLRGDPRHALRMRPGEVRASDAHGHRLRAAAVQGRAARS